MTGFEAPKAAAARHQTTGAHKAAEAQRDVLFGRKPAAAPASASSRPSGTAAATVSVAASDKEEEAQRSALFGKSASKKQPVSAAAPAQDTRQLAQPLPNHPPAIKTASTQEQPAGKKRTFSRNKPKETASARPSEEGGQSAATAEAGEEAARSALFARPASKPEKVGHDRPRFQWCCSNATVSSICWLATALQGSLLHLYSCKPAEHLDSGCNCPGACFPASRLHSGAHSCCNDLHFVLQMSKSSASTGREPTPATAQGSSTSTGTCA